MKAATTKINGAIDKTVRGAVLEMFGEIVRRTPVGNPSLWQNDAPAGYTGGRLRGNWQVQRRTPNYSTLEIEDAGGSATIGRGSQEINQFDMEDKVLYITNNLPYAERVENGWSKQAPSGMMRTTVEAFRPFIEKHSRQNKV